MPLPTKCTHTPGHRTIHYGKSALPYITCKLCNANGQMLKGKIKWSDGTTEVTDQ